MTASQLKTWKSGATKQEIEGFVARVTHPGSRDFVAPEERVAVFDNDGTLWCEKPMPVELGFIMQRLGDMAQKDATLRGRQPWKAAYDEDYGWIGGVVTKHYQGDDSDVRLLIRGILQAFAGMTVEAYQAAAESYLHMGRHPTLGRGLCECGYQPMVGLLRYLEDNGFTCYIASGGDRDFMRVVTYEMFGIPPERVIGSSNALRFKETDQGGSIAYSAHPDIFDDGPVKPVRIWSRTGRRPILACGNSNGDIPMLQYAGSSRRPCLRLLVVHDDHEREFAYPAGAEQVLDRAHVGGWCTISMKDDWRTVFAPRARAVMARSLSM